MKRLLQRLGLPNRQQTSVENGLKEFGGKHRLEPISQRRSVMVWSSKQTDDTATESTEFFCQVSHSLALIKRTYNTSLELPALASGYI